MKDLNVSFYCVCKDKKSNVPTHPFYGTTDLVTDTSILDCDECEDKAEIIVLELIEVVNQKCLQVLV